MKQYFLLIICLWQVVAYGQIKKKENPIVFAESFLGVSAGRAGGLSYGTELNYQIKKSFFTVRQVYSHRLTLKPVMLTPITPFVIINGIYNSEEYSALYGLRFINIRQSLNISFGVSRNSYREIYNFENNQQTEKVTTYTGVPYEVNIKWFKEEKRIFKIYGIIPVGKPTAFGSGVGVKLFGNISKNSYVGIGLACGYGFHKKY
ncbi:MAG TPA: hypothetical protein VNI52_07305 [Sphingobacteriaceae bacterium]|nr:hypothetical protein [Sphingobacteriaceae bacterium]